MPEIKGAKIISFSIYKGGTGKTTSSVNTAAALANLNNRVLLVDLDLQCSATRYLGLDPHELQYSMYHVFYQNVPASVVRQKTEFGIDILPSTSLMAAIEGAALNVRINLGSLTDEQWAANARSAAESFIKQCREKAEQVREAIEAALDG